MRHIRFHNCLLIGFALLSAACSPAVATRVAKSRTPMVVPSPATQHAPTAAPPTPASTVAPTQAPVATNLPGATSTIVTPEGFYATAQSAQEATMIARATISPFPTSGAVEIKLGSPASAMARRDGLSFTVQLPKDSFLAARKWPRADHAAQRWTRNTHDQWRRSQPGAGALARRTRARGRSLSMVFHPALSRSTLHAQARAGASPHGDDVVSTAA